MRLFIFLLLVASSWTYADTLQPSKETDASTIIDSEISQSFGGWLFNGGFLNTSFSGVNPDYRIAQGDRLLVQLWGGIDYQQEVAVDPQGNIFVPKVGPIKVLGVKNSELNKVVLKAIKRVYKSNVDAYIALLSSQKVKVFLSGMVNKPGLYEGQSADSVLKFIDMAGGIRSDIGSFRNISLRRGNKEHSKIDLYEYIEKGDMPITQLQDGDTIFIGPKNGTVTLEGDIGFQGVYELDGNRANLNDILSSVVMDDKATHVTVVETIDQASVKKEVQAKRYALSELKKIQVKPGALVRVSSQYRAKSISVAVKGEHDSAFEFVLPWGATLQDLLDQIAYTPLSNSQAVQLYRDSVAKRQKDMLNASLDALEQNILTTRSATNEGAQLRKAEAEIIMKWIEKARKVEPRGQVLLTEGYDPAAITLQQGDTIVVPTKRNIVLVHGEVLFPTAVAYNQEETTDDFIKHAGGTREDLDDMKVLVMKPNGSFINVSDDLNDEDAIEPGDEVFVLARPDVKSLQIAKDVMQVIYQIAVSSAVVLTL